MEYYELPDGCTVERTSDTELWVVRNPDGTVVFRGCRREVEREFGRFGRNAAEFLEDARQGFGQFMYYGAIIMAIMAVLGWIAVGGC